MVEILGRRQIKEKPATGIDDDNWGVILFIYLFCKDSPEWLH